MGSSNGLTSALLDAGVDVHFMRDATRGGVATVLNEIAQQARLAVAIDDGCAARARRGPRGR